MDREIFVKLWLATAAISLFPLCSIASSNSQELLQSNIDIHNKASLRRGARLYMNHCAACHSAKFMRYERLSKDLEIPPEIVMSDLVRFGATRLSDAIPAAIDPKVGEKAFGIAPPDLTLEAKYRGTDWVYSYLLGFYKDSNAPTGYNNHLMANVAMPWVLASLQEATSEAEFKDQMRDLTNFMAYMSEPIRPFRENFGKYVLGFLMVLLVSVRLLKNEYWRSLNE
ncbi:MAG: cytochrome C [Gammaproteobacteria bacterium]|nr:cytochrome C [Gammaproteobacteria bacterium]